MGVAVICSLSPKVNPGLFDFGNSLVTLFESLFFIAAGRLKEIELMQTFGTR